MSAQIQARFTGDRELAQRLKRISEDSRKLFRAALREVGKRKLERSQELVPFKRGKLHNSARLSVRVGDKQVSVTIRYGGPDVRYAIRVHEDLEAKHRGQRRAKFLESVIVATNLGEELEELIDLGRAQFLESVLGGGAEPEGLGD